MADISRNSPCPCGSGKKYKKCCGATVVTAKLLTEAEGKHFWTPDGVTTANDDTPGAFSGSIKWLMTYEPPKDGTPANDAEIIIERLVRPYVKQHCGMKDDGEDDNLKIALLQSRIRRGEVLTDCPSVELGRYCQLMEMLRKRLEEFFKYFSDSIYRCEVRSDSCFGGPILTLEDERGLAEIFMVAIAESFDECGDKAT